MVRRSGSALLLLFLFACPALADSWGPWGAPSRSPPAPPAEPGSQTWALLWAVRAYQLFVSPADGAGCTYYPTCSGYSLQALRKHGPLTGFVMTAERVNRNHSNRDAYFPQIHHHGRTYLYDPVENNDFWFGPSPRTGTNLFAHPELPTEIFWDRY